MGRLSPALLLAVLIAFAALSAAEPEAAAQPRVELSAAPAQVAVGDPITVTLSWSWPAGMTVVTEPDPAVDFHDCFVTNVPPVQATRTGEGERRSVKLTLIAATSGAWALPRPKLTVAGTGGPVTTQAAAVIVQVGTEAKPPVLPDPVPPRVRPSAAETPSHRAWWIGGGAALAVGLIALVLFLRRRAVAAVAVPPAERFAAELRRLQAITDGKDLGAGLSLALRRYVGEVFRFDGAGATTRELAALLTRVSQPDDERRVLIRLLERLDDVRWAPGELDAATVRPVADEAAAYVAQVERRLAQPAPAAEARPAVAGSTR